MIAIVKLLTGPFGNIITWVLIAVVAATEAYAALQIHDSNVRQAALMEYNKNQLEQVVKDQNQLIENQKALAKSLKELSTTLEESIASLDTLSGSIDEALAQKNIPDYNDQAPETIKEVIRELRKSVK